MGNSTVLRKMGQQCLARMLLHAIAIFWNVTTLIRFFSKVSSNKFYTIYPKLYCYVLCISENFTLYTFHHHHLHHCHHLYICILEVQAEVKDITESPKADLNESEVPFCNTVFKLLNTKLNSGDRVLCFCKIYFNWHPSTYLWLPKWSYPFRFSD